MQAISERLRHAAEHIPEGRISHRMLMRAAGRADQLEHALEPMLHKLPWKRSRMDQAQPAQTPPSQAEALPMTPSPATPEARSWDEVDEASWESFPASDPPAHWAGKDRC